MQIAETVVIYLFIYLFICLCNRLRQMATYIQEAQRDAFTGQSMSPNKHGTIPCVRCGFLSVCYSNFVPKTNRFRYIWLQNAMSFSKPG